MFNDTSHGSLLHLRLDLPTMLTRGGLHYLHDLPDHWISKTINSKTAAIADTEEQSEITVCLGIRTSGKKGSV